MMQMYLNLQHLGIIAYYDESCVMIDNFVSDDRIDRDNRLSVVADILPMAGTGLQHMFLPTNSDLGLGDGWTSWCDKQYMLAKHILNNTYYDSNSRGKVKTWLTYRAYDGSVDFDDWADNISVVDIQMSARWYYSYITALVYLYIKRGKIDLAIDIMEDMMRGNRLAEWPSATFNYCRCVSLLAYYYYVTNDDKKSLDVIDTAITVWVRTMYEFSPIRIPVRFLSMHRDVYALHIMVMLKHKMGKLFTDRGRNVKFIFSDMNDVRCNLVESIKESNCPWWECMKLIGNYGTRKLVFDDSKLLVLSGV